jgi:TatD DNase family protein
MNPKRSNSSSDFHLVDSHAHLDMDDFDPDRDEVIGRAYQAGVRAILCPMDVTSLKSIQTTLEMGSRHPHVYSAAGVHPHQAKLFNPDYLSRIKEFARDKNVVAIGEIGLDFHYDFSSPDEQRAAFRAQLALAKDLRCPAIIHSRNAGREIAAAVREEYFYSGGVLHCFTEDWEFAKTMLDWNFFISFSGILTFANAQPLRDIAQMLPLSRVLIETDSPYLTPAPFRGIKKRNEPALVIETARVLADLKKVSVAEIAQATTQNFYRAFRIPDPGSQPHI